jgi:hypothetical protein
MRTTYEEDFPAIFDKKRSKKLAKRRQKDEQSRAAELMSARTYQLMVSALEDLVSQKRGLQAAFRLWRAAVGMQPPPPPAPPLPLSLAGGGGGPGPGLEADPSAEAEAAAAGGGGIERQLSAAPSADDDNSIYTK